MVPSEEFKESMTLLKDHNNLTEMMSGKLNIKWATFLFLVVGFNSQAQEVYGTANGLVQITGVLDDSMLFATSNELVVILNYETAEFELRLDKSTLTTGVDSLDIRLKSLKGEFIIYTGKLGIEFIKTQKHAPQDFDVEGELIWNSKNEIINGLGHLEHIFNSVYSCVLNMSFHLNLDDLKFDIGLLGLEDEIHVEILQAVLSRTNE